MAVGGGPLLERPRPPGDDGAASVGLTTRDTSPLQSASRGGIAAVGPLCGRAPGLVARSAG
jgi:hypothetical protein